MLDHEHLPISTKRRRRSYNEHRKQLWLPWYVAVLIFSSFACAQSQSQQPQGQSFFNGTHAYMRLTSNELVSIPVNRAYKSSQDAVDKIKAHSLPPPDAPDIALSRGNQLLAFGSQGGKCGDKSKMKVYTYNAGNDTWNEFAESDDTFSFHRNSTIWADGTSNDLLLYGGRCKDKVTSQLVRFNSATKQFTHADSHPDGSSSPTKLFGAGSSPISVTEFLIMGGQPNEKAWIGMDQVAVYQDGTWTFRTVQNGDKIDSRTGALVVPLGQKDTKAKLLVIGGTVAGRQAKPYIAQLDLNRDKGWSWSEVKPEDNDDNLLGAFATKDTLLTVRAPRGKKREHGFDVGFVDTGTWSKRDSFEPQADTKASQTSSSEPSETATKTPKPSSKNDDDDGDGLSHGAIAAISTTVPLGMACAAGLLLFFVRRHKKRDKEYVPYQKRNLTLSPTWSSSIDKFPTDKSEAGGSIDSWMEKREWYKEQNPEKLRPRHTSAQKPQEQQPPGSPDSQATRRPVSYGAATLTEEPGVVDEKTDGQEVAKNKNDDDQDAYFLGRDVQVLVSSLRRSKLTVVNPDVHATNSDDEESNYNSVQISPKQLRTNEQSYPY